MRVLNTFSALQKITSAFLNSLQAAVLGSSSASGASNSLSAAGMVGGDTIWYQTGTAVTNGTLVLLDAGDWRDRMAWGSCFLLASGAYSVGQSTDYNLDATVLASVYTTFEGYTGAGAVSNLTTGAAVSNGNAPVRGSGAHKSWYVNLTGTAGGVMLYADPSNGKLYFYNASGATVYPALRLMFSGVTGAGS